MQGQSVFNIEMFDINVVYVWAENAAVLRCLIQT